MLTPKQNPPLTTCKRQDLNCLWSFFVASLKSVHMLCNHFRGVGGGRGGDRAMMILMTQKGVGRSELGKSSVRNMRSARSLVGLDIKRTLHTTQSATQTLPEGLMNIC